MNRITFPRYLLCAFLLVAQSFYGFAQNAEVENEIQDIMKKYSAIGVSVAVVKQNKIIYTHSFGLKNVENNIPLTDQDIFRIASISKSFSATSIMQLVEAGKLSLDTDFSDLVGFKVRNPKFPETVITLKMMLSHRSSLNDSQGYLKLDVINPDKNPEWAKCYNNYEPGKGYEYCNLNFNLIGTVIEKISGERFDNYVKNHLLKPMGLYAGYCVDSLDANRFVTLYEYHNDTKTFTAAPTAYAPRREEIKNYVMGYSTPIFSPTGGMKISATDLAKYMTMHMNYGNYNGIKIMSKKHAKLMQTKISEEEDYAMAMRSVEDLIPGLTLKGHTGSAYGLYSAMFFNPKEKYGIVVITNGCNPIYTNGYCDLIQASVNSLYNNLIK
ncbi:serine hydrolase [Pedobacter yonginense]|uniref:Serine hydrolase n=1 Tax=Pedobacter yonginense TaxID=651869 RepID=A0A317ES87_9SPHI|nr:serine hydrolase domain-containing protein [Pedobacter yonginense]PWS28723.1 serine hydrolase [Pedobacter yonginense]